MIHKAISTTIQNNTQAAEMVRTFQRTMPRIGALDTETTGLHIIHALPFLLQFGWYSPSEEIIYTYAVDLERQPLLGHQVANAWLKLSADLEKLLGHNIKFDVHMMKNFGVPFEVENLSDTMFYIRLCHDARTPKMGGPPLKLKEYCTQYIDRSASYHEQLLNVSKTAIVKDLNKKLLVRLDKRWKTSDLNDFFKDKIHSVDDLSTRDQEAYNQWLNNDVPPIMRDRITGIVTNEDIPYSILPRDQVITYGHMDIVWTIEIYLKLHPVLLAKQNEYAMQLEEDIILPLYEMERTGFDVNMGYLEDSRQKMKAYIIRRRADFAVLCGEPVKTGQSERLLQIAREHFGIALASTEESSIIQELDSVPQEHPIHEWADTLQELRTLEKWYSTYIIRFLKNIDAEHKLYTTINQVGTVTGRVTSDFQQFPKGGITTKDGEVLFTPREMVCVPTDSEYDGIVYLDYSQIELRIQAMYTILVGHPEANLYGAYGPINCYHKELGLFDCQNPKHIATWDSEWYTDTTYVTRWVPQDVHAATTKYAFNIEEDDPNFKKYRSIGKTINFAKNYGAQKKRIRQMFPDASEEDVERINDAYYKAFPGVKHYHDYCYRLVNFQNYATNLFGVRYYGVSGHNLINLLIQGSGAYLLKIKIRLIYDYCKKHNVKSKLQMNIHDELSWLKHKTELDVFFEFKHIMEYWQDTLVPIVAEMDATATTWAAKQGIHSKEDLEKLYAR